MLFFLLVKGRMKTPNVTHARVLEQVTCGWAELLRAQGRPKCHYAFAS